MKDRSRTHCGVGHAPLPQSAPAEASSIACIRTHFQPELLTILDER